jgi:alpha-glucosidase
MTHQWWQRGVVYQIYPRSLQDSNGDGVGDIGGILQRLDYFDSLAVDALWLSPVYPSPMADFGYDVSNYTDIHPMFGTLREFDTLVAALQRRNLKLILDFVPNHTSDRHPWFEAARRNRDSDKRDWYLWRDPAPGGGPPNNWLSQFGGSAWEYDAPSGQYYYHAFLKEQPDLNWRNPAVRAAMYDVLRFWLRRGVDGFRVDVLWHLIKDDQWRDNPPNPAFKPGDPPHQSQLPLYNTDRPEVQGIVTQMRQVLDEFDERVLIGEIYLPVERLVSYYGVNNDGAHLPFNFQLLASAWDARGIAGLIDQYERALPAGGWPNWVLGNHDNSRIASRVGLPQARVAAMLLLTLRGTPTMYYGDELGMVNGVIPPDRVRDPFEKNVPGMGLGRDPCRTPMQWDESRHAGFSTAEPWLPISDDYSEVNVATETADAGSLLTLYRRLLELRRAHAALAVGDYEPVAMTGDLVAYIRRTPGPGRDARRSVGQPVVGEAFLVALNLGAGPYELSLASLGLRGRVTMSTHLDRTDDANTQSVALRANEGVIVQLSAIAA